MNRQTLVRLCSVLVVLIALALLLSRAMRSSRSPQLSKEPLSNKASKLELSGPFGREVLTRSSSTWTMESPVAYPADASVIGTVLDGLKDIHLSDELSNDPTRYGLFGLNDSSATRVQVFLANEQTPNLDFFVGKNGSQYNTFFMHFAGKSGVLEADGLSADGFARKPEEWLDKTVCTVAPDSIMELKIHAEKDSTALRHKDGKWEDARSGRVLSSSTVEQTLTPVLAFLNPLAAENILIAQGGPSTKDMGVDHPEISIDVMSLNPNESVSLKVGKKNDRGFHYVVRSGENRVYFLIADWKFTPLRKKELFGKK